LESSGAHTTILHEADIAHFAEVGFDVLVRALANQLGFQGDVVKTVYGHLTSYEQTVQVIESMQEAAEEHAVTKILSKNESGDEESGDEESGDEESNYGESMKEESMKEESVKEEHKDDENKDIKEE
jgi:hypothetical protein